MQRAIRFLAVTAGLLAAQVALAQVPAGSTGQCKDGTYTTAASKQGACHGHQGVKDWYAAAPAAPTAAAATAAAPAAPKTPAAPAPTAAVGPKPANATGLCNDGTYATSTSKSAGCRGHQGVKDWYSAAAPAAAAPATAPAAPAPKTAVAPAPSAPAPTAAMAPAKAAASSTSSKTASMTQVAGGGPGLVWVNTSSNVYHCYGSSYYGKTKEGSYMSEADAKSKGAHPDHGKACSQ